MNIIKNRIHIGKTPSVGPSDSRFDSQFHRDRCKQRIERQLGIIGKAATDNEIEDMIEKSKDGQNVQLFTGVSLLSLLTVVDIVILDQYGCPTDA